MQPVGKGFDLRRIANLSPGGRRPAGFDQSKSQGLSLWEIMGRSGLQERKPRGREAQQASDR